MIIFHTPEERWANSLWEMPIFVGEVKLKNVIFCPSGPIFPDGALARLILRDANSDVAHLVIEKDIKRFQELSFEITFLLQTRKYLTLLKEPTVGKNIALPIALVQVETW